MRRQIVVVEDDPMTGGLLADVLRRAGFDVATASNAAEARRLTTEVDPDALVLDIDLGGGPTGFDVADALLASHPHLGILFLTNLPDSRFAGRSSGSLPTGVGYLRKERLAQPGVLVAALEGALRGAGHAQIRDDQDPGRPFNELSDPQVEVLRMVALGMSNYQIADARGTSVRAVVSLLARVLFAVGVSDGDDGHARILAARKYMSAAGIPTAAA